MIAFHIRKANAIKLYDLETGELSEELKYSENGPNALPNIYDFHIHDQDHIFLNRRYHYQLHLVDDKFNLKRTYDFLDTDVKLDPNSGMPLSKDTFLPVFNHNRLFKSLGNYFVLTGSPDLDPDLFNYFDSDCLLVKVSRKNNDIQRGTGYSPKLKGKAWGSFHAFLYTEISLDKEVFFLSYAADDEIYIKDLNFSDIRSFRADPNKYKQILPLPSSARESEKSYLSHYNEQYIFGSVLYDKFRELIYRIALEPNPDYGDVFVKDPLFRPRNMVVMAFDPKQEYKKVAEMRLLQTEKGVYLDRCFVNEKGLNITYVDFENEDKLYFKTFVVE